MPLTPVRSDLIQRPAADALRMRGLLGRRHDASRLNRLRHQEEYHLLWPFQERCPVGYDHSPHPEITRGDWQGEFIGTWVAAATLAARYASDDQLQAKVDALVRDWVATQQPDGYLGTYREADRWKSWDVWVQAHDLIGLLTYHDQTGDKTALAAAVRVADRLLQDFGPGRRSLHATGPHSGMASSAVLEPMVWLYWKTGDQRYLDFSRWLVDEDWEAPGGPAIRSTLLAGRGVAEIANAKAAEMIIDFTGMVELYRATGDARYLEPVLRGVEDIARYHLYITGSASTGELFQRDYRLRNDGQFRLGETCVTMTWLYLNLSLGRLTGEARFFDLAEQALYNHLLGAQSPDGRGWAYYTGLRDGKRYRWHTDPDCCPSRGVRGLAQIPEHVLGLTDDGLAVNFYEAAEATLALAAGPALRLAIETEHPFDGQVRLRLSPERPAHFTLHLRLPGWCTEWELSVNAAAERPAPDARGYLVLSREWRAGDTVDLDLAMPPRVLVDTLGNNGRVALMRGPLVYAADSALLPPGRLLDDVVLALDPEAPARAVQVERVEDEEAPRLVVPMAVSNLPVGPGAWGVEERYRDLAACVAPAAGEEIALVPFFEAGNRDPECYRDGVWSNREPATNVSYQVWLPYSCRSG